MRMSTSKAMALAWSALFIAAALASGCGEGRFPTCKSNADCGGGDGKPGGKICYNLKCVECQYDSDCAVGKTCNRNLNECQSLGTPAGGDDAQEKETSWEPANWDECAKRCKEQACLSDCDARFKK